MILGNHHHGRVTTPSNKRMQLTKLRAAPVLQAEVPPCAPAAGTDGGTASQLIRGVFSSERRNIPAMIRVAWSGRLGWSVSGRGTPGG